MTSLDQINDTIWQREKTAIIQTITKVTPSTVLLDVVCVPLEIIGGAVSRSVVVCTEMRPDNAARAAIRTHIAALSPREHPFDVLFRTGEITRNYAEVIGARREWIVLVWDLVPALGCAGDDGDDGGDAIASQGFLDRNYKGKHDGGNSKEQQEEMRIMVDDLVKAEVSKALQQIEAEMAAEQVEDEVHEAKAESLSRVRPATDLNHAAKPSGRLQAPRKIIISAIPSRLQAPSRPRPTSPRGLARPLARAQSVSLPRQTRHATPRAPGQEEQKQQQEQKQQNPRTQQPLVDGVSKLQGPRRMTLPSLAPVVRAPAQSKLEMPQAIKFSSRIVQPRARAESMGKSLVPRGNPKVPGPPQVRGRSRPAANDTLGMSGQSTRSAMLTRSLPRPKRE